MFFENVKKVYFVGIGGAGVSAIARMMLESGKLVKGSNLTKSEITKDLEKLGAVVYIGHSESNLDSDTDFVVYSPAVLQNNPELQKAKKLNIFTISYPQALGLISKDRYTIVISGTHGKTTTTAMLAEVLGSAKLDPTVVVGSLLKKQKTNFIYGNSKYFVVEACEYKRSFLQLQPNILVITNIDIDHLDYYRGLADIQRAFRKLVLKMREDDYVICNLNDKNILPVVEKIKARVVDYSKYKTVNFDLGVPGKHNIENALACLAAAKALDINQQKTIETLNNFEGTWRRFEFKGKTKKGTLIYDDYAHTPTEIEATLKGARDFFKKRNGIDKNITVIFQPHLFSRTKFFLKEFAKRLGSADKIIVLPIFAAREKSDSNINSQMLVEEIKKYNRDVFFIKNENFSKVFNLNNFGPDDIIITMGAGDVYTLITKLNFNN